MTHRISSPIDLSNVRFRKSTKSDGTGNGNCVEVGCPNPTVVAVRDSKLPTEGDFPHLLVDNDAWTGLLAGIKDGSIT